ncbi:hypothetical protein C8R48DRAFT_45654 [Suillus tomentosus]|nr:hypothetical protein C8R48DRAFT_45654 [Suillus tomentosus]
MTCDTSKITSNLMHRPGGQRRHGISLPKSLLEQINTTEQSSHRHKSGRSHASRKDARKQERTDRKKRKADHFIHSPYSAKRKTEEEHVNSPQRKRMKTSQEYRRVLGLRNRIPPPSLCRSKNLKPLR